MRGGRSRGRSYFFFSEEVICLLKGFDDTSSRTRLRARKTDRRKLTNMKIFLVALLLVLITAWIYPYLGATREFGWLVKRVGVSIIFLRSGLDIETKKLVQAISDWKVTGGVLLFHFLLCPMLFKLVSSLVLSTGLLSTGLATGYLIVGVLPPPISSAVIIVTVARGNAALSIVASTLGSLVGVIATPALLVAAVGVQSEVSANALVAQLGTTVLFPLVIGQLARRFGAPKIPSVIGKGLLLGIIFHVFSKTFLKPVPVDFRDLVMVVVLILLTQMCLLATIAFVTHRWLHFSRRDVVALMFSGSHKSLTLGMPILMAMYGESVPAFIVLPLLVYHPTQIILGSVLASKCSEFIDGEMNVSSVGLELQSSQRVVRLSKDSDGGGGGAVPRSPGLRSTSSMMV